MAEARSSVFRPRPISLKPTCPLELYTKKLLISFSEKAPSLPTKMLNTPTKRNTTVVIEENT